MSVVYRLHCLMAWVKAALMIWDTQPKSLPQHQGFLEDCEYHIMISCSLICLPHQTGALRRQKKGSAPFTFLSAGTSTVSSTHSIFESGRERSKTEKGVEYSGKRQPNFVTAF